MKLHKIILPVFGLAMGATVMTSCNDDFLEVYPQTSLTDQNAFQSYENYRSYMYNCYSLFTNASIFTNHSGGSYYWGGQYSSDFWSGLITNREGTTQTSQNPYAWQNITTTTTSSYWNFTPIRTINIFIEHLDDGQLTETEKNHWRAVAYFFHSFWYMELVNKYGDVPYITQVLSDTSEEAYGPRTPRAEVVENIIQRLEYAIANIGDTSKDGDNPVTANAARALLSRFLLREATWAKYHNLNEPWQQYLEKCMTVSQELMSAYPALYYGKGINKYPAAGYDEIMTSESLNGVPGVIMYKEYIAPLTMHRFSDLIHVEAHRADAPQHTVDMFLMANGKPINNVNSGFKGGEGKDLYDYFADRDPRLYINFQPPAAAFIANFGNPDNVNTFKKWRFFEAGDNLGSFPIDEEYAAKMRKFIDYFGPNIFCENGTGDETIGVKRLPGHNWGGTMSHGSPNLNGSQLDNYMRCLTGYYFWKEFTMWENGNNDAYQTSDKPIFTIEEVLLNYAEAAWELNRFSQAVADQTINKLRDRAGVAPMNVAEIDANFDPDRDKGTASWTRGYDALTNYEVDPVLWEIRRERMIELFGQGFAFYDIRRWHKAPYYVNRQSCGMWIDRDHFPYGTGKYNDSYTLVDYNEIQTNGYSLSNPSATKGWIYNGGGCLSTGKGWLDAYYLWMVPTHEINMNPNLTQNPGYESLFGSAGSSED